MKASGLTSVVLRHIFVLLNQYGHPRIEPKFFRTSFVKNLTPGSETGSLLLPKYVIVKFFS